MTQICQTCGAQTMAEGAFCTSCGSSLHAAVATAVAPPPAAGNAVTAEMAGRPCPYCRFPLKEGGTASTCPSCKAVHHEDCWGENAGCAVNGCGAKAAAPATAPPAPVTIDPAGLEAPTALLNSSAPYAPAPHVTLGSAGPPPRSSNRAWTAAIVVIVLLLALGGGGAALLVSSQKSHASSPTSGPSANVSPPTDIAIPPPGSDANPNTTNTDTPTTDSTPTEPSTPSSVDTSAYGANGPPPSSGDTSAIESAAQRVLVKHHDYISSGDYDSAWQELSPRYRRLKVDDTNSDGQSYGDGSMTSAPSLWVHDMQTGFPGPIDTSGLSASIDRIHGNDAWVQVTGMRYQNSSGSTCPWDGVTWVSYQDGKWWYDPGTSHHPDRVNVYGPRGDFRNFRGRC
jgi:Prokaryotic RING finger family 1